METKKNILVAVSGLTPQIVSEAFFCLSVRNKIRIDEIYILTTKRGRDVIAGRDKGASAFKTNLKTEIEGCCRLYKIPLPGFEINDKHVIVAREESVELNDIRNDRENNLFPNKVSVVISSLTADPDNVLFCIISGGRKSMSVHLALAMTLFGRENDKIYHVLTSEENEFKDYYPKNKSQMNALILSDIPFVRVRPFLNVRQEILKKKYSELVNYTQKQLKIVSGKKELYLDIIRRESSFEGNKIILEPLEFALYFYFVRKVIEGEKWISIHTLISVEAAKDLKSFIEENYIYYHFDSSLKSAWWVKGLTAENFRSKRTKINGKLKTIFSDPDIFTLFGISSDRIYGETRYLLRAKKEQFKISYP